MSYLPTKAPRHHRAAVITLLVITAVLIASTTVARAATTRPAASTAAQGSAVATLIQQLQTEYQGSFASHNPLAAAHVRGMAAAASALAAADHGAHARRVRKAAAKLERVLAVTSSKFEIWPYPDTVTKLAAAVGHDLTRAAPGRLTPLHATAVLTALVTNASEQAAAHRAPPASAALAEAYAVFASDTAPKLGAVAPELVTQTERDLFSGIATEGNPVSATQAGQAAALAGTDLHEDAASLGQVTVSRATIVTDAAIILFREGLEAVLILAAITASFTGARKHLRRPVLIGGLLGLGATAVTYVLAQVIVDAFGDGGLRLQAITGIVAIIVLLIVTNWFFHKVYWSEWIARFNRRRKTLEKVDKLGFISGQTLGLLILGLTSVYREGFETVLFLQNLQVSAGTSATLLGVAIGLAATFVVGVITFALGRKLPYKKMLIVTGVMIGLVLAVMTGTTVNNLQGIGWLPTTSTGFTVDLRVSQWTGFYATWEGIVAQLLALLVVYGSYAIARQLQLHRRRRAISSLALASE